MNTRTKKELISLCEAVQQLAIGMENDLGITTTSDICDKAENCKRALNNDETIVEVS